MISDQPLTEHVPLYKGPKDEIVTQYSMGDVENRPAKFDFLGSENVDDDSAGRVSRQPGLPRPAPLRVEQLPFDDPATFAPALSSGKTTGVFQLESSGMRDLLMGLKPDRFEDTSPSSRSIVPVPWI